MAKKNKEEAKPVAKVAAPQALPLPAKLAFDAWWAMKEKKIPVQHRKEIIWADFRARGLSTKETMQSYNDALKRYGVKLN
jgi:hypothetical protein